MGTTESKVSPSVFCTDEPANINIQATCNIMKKEDLGLLPDTTMLELTPETY